VASRARPARGRTAAGRATRSQPDPKTGSAASRRSAARPIWPQPIGTWNEVEIEMEMDVREFLIGGL